MKDLTSVSPGVRKLAQAPERVNAGRLWRALSAEGRTRAAALGLMRDDKVKHRAVLVIEIAELLRFRTQTVAGWPDEKIVATAARLETLDPDTIDSFLIALHLVDRRPMLGSFMDALKVPHVQGCVDAMPKDPPADDVHMAAAAGALLDTYPADEVLLYLLTLYYQDRRVWESLAIWLRSLFTITEPEPRSPAPEPPQPSVMTEDPEGFTTLDRRLIRVVVDSAQGVLGAPSEDELDDLIDEIVELSSDRHRSFFHAGFRDAVFKRPIRGELAAENADRRRWYIGGFVQGLARREQWSAIAVLFDQEPHARGLGDTGRGPSRVAAPLIFRALCETNRAREAVAFLSVTALVQLLPQSGADVLNQGKRLLRADRGSDAKATLTLLSNAVAEIHANGGDIPTDFDQDLRRRLAHCHRQLGEVTRATELLQGLLAERTLDRRSMVLVDLGLLACGFRRLADLRLPMESEDLEPFKETLRKGEPLFHEALEVGDGYVSHARFCLGVLALVSGEYEHALRHLDEAVSAFEANPGVYKPGGLLRNARLYLALAICHHLEVGRMERAHELIREACAEGAGIPPYVVEPTLAALEMVEEALGKSVAEAILEAGGEDVLDTLAASPVTRGSDAVATALRHRGSDGSRSVNARLHDYHVVLPLLLHQKRYQQAEEALDFLEEQALMDVGTDRFLRVLEHPNSYEPAWELDDARWSTINCLEALGLYDEARLHLEAEFHRELAGRRYGYLDDAAGVLDRIRSYGLPEESITHLSRRLEAERVDQEPTGRSSAKTERRSVRVLVVGGNETQTRYDEDIRAQLASVRPDIEVAFEHTGWTSNWGKQLEDIKRRLSQYDVVVIMRLIRTMLGRRLRAACVNVPWRGCGGGGRRAIRDCVVLAADMVRGRERL